MPDTPTKPTPTERDIEEAWDIVVQNFPTPRTTCRPAQLRDDIAQALATARREGREKFASSLDGVWKQAQENHARYSQTGSAEDDLLFFALGLAGEAGELANFVKKQWRDGDDHRDALRLECADVLAYTMMCADVLGMTPADLIEMVAYKQRVFIQKMEARSLPEQEDGR